MQSKQSFRSFLGKSAFAKFENILNAACYDPIE